MKTLGYMDLQSLIRAEATQAKAAKDREQEARARRQLRANTVAQEIRQHVRKQGYRV